MDRLGTLGRENSWAATPSKILGSLLKKVDFKPTRLRLLDGTKKCLACNMQHA